jgi:hypothetical protein
MSFLHEPQIIASELKMGTNIIQLFTLVQVKIRIYRSKIYYIYRGLILIEMKVSNCFYYMKLLLMSSGLSFINCH